MDTAQFSQGQVSHAFSGEPATEGVVVRPLNKRVLVLRVCDRQLQQLLEPLIERTVELIVSEQFVRDMERWALV